MAKPKEPSDPSKRIKLPSERSIDVVRCSKAPEESACESVPKQAPASGAERELHVCPACCSTLVYPTEWQERGAEHWRLSLRCPSCEGRESGVFSQEIANRFDEELERGTEVMVRDLRRLTRANMAEEIERLAAALDADAIQPMDF